VQELQKLIVDKVDSTDFRMGMEMKGNKVDVEELMSKADVL